MSTIKSGSLKLPAAFTIWLYDSSVNRSGTRTHNTLVIIAKFAELILKLGAENGNRTHDLLFGKQML